MSTTMDDYSRSTSSKAACITPAPDENGYVQQMTVAAFDHTTHRLPPPLYSQFCSGSAQLHISFKHLSTENEFAGSSSRQQSGRRVVSSFARYPQAINSVS